PPPPLHDTSFPTRRSSDLIERDEAIAGRHVQHSLVALAVGPVRDAASRQLARRDRGAVAFTVAVRPDQLSRFPVERDHRASRAEIGRATSELQSPYDLVCR